MHLSAEHDASEEREEESFKHSKQGEDEGQGARHHCVTVLKVLPHTAEEKPGHHRQTKHRHRHDIELQKETIISNFGNQGEA